jgi:uncharacterized membrane protein YciS (DUF1049 family)
MQNLSLLMVALVIALTWMILYCFYIKQQLKNRCDHLQKQIYDINALKNHTDNSVYALARALGYKRCPTLGFVKESVDIK